MAEQTPSAGAWRKWAAERLGVSADASAQEARSAFFAALPESEFIPTAEMRSALQLRLANDRQQEPARRALAAFRKCQVQALYESIEKFARAYWSLEPARRQEVHARLLSGARSLPLAKLRLASLSEGLAVDAVTGADDDPTRALAVRVQELYVLPPIDRAVRRRELGNSLCTDSGGSIAFQLLQKDFPEMARLEKALNPAGLAAPPKLRRKLPRARDLLSPARRVSNRDSWLRRSSPGILGQVGWVLLCLLLSGGVKACATLSNSPTVRSESDVNGQQERSKTTTIKPGVSPRR
jgi:hypothetical protein